MNLPQLAGLLYAKIIVYAWPEEHHGTEPGTCPMGSFFTDPSLKDGSIRPVSYCAQYIH